MTNKVPLRIAARIDQQTLDALALIRSFLHTPWRRASLGDAIRLVIANGIEQATRVAIGRNVKLGIEKSPERFVFSLDRFVVVRACILCGTLTTAGVRQRCEIGYEPACLGCLERHAIEMEKEDD